MKVIGIVGGIGAGKSTIVALMNEITPMSMISADLIGHEILIKGNLGYEKIVTQFGTSILNQEEEIVRKKLGEIVFGCPEKLKALNQITHPIITNCIKSRIEQAKKTAPGRHIILEAALLLESGLVELTDVVVAVYADQQLRLDRVIKRENLSPTQILKRMEAQQEWEIVKDAADYVIDNSFSLEKTKLQIEELLAQL